MRITNLAAILLGAVLVMAWPLVGSAHVHLHKSIPESGESLTEAPKRVEVWYSGKVDAEWSKIEVTDSNGQRVDIGKVSRGENAKHLFVSLKPLAAGDYKVSLSVIAGDGHRIKDVFSFSIR